VDEEETSLIYDKAKFLKHDPEARAYVMGYHLLDSRYKKFPF
jgi:hypothetical protein